MQELFQNIEMPLSKVLGDMEFAGIYVDEKVLDEMGQAIYDKSNEIEQEIYELAGEEFNISSPKQLGEILFEKLGLKHGNKIRIFYIH